MSPRLSVELDERPYAPGESVRGSVLVQEGGGSRGVDVSLNYHEQSIDYNEIARSVSAGRVHHGDLTAGQSFPFELRIPEDATPGVVSAAGHLYWSVDVKSDEFGPDTRESVSIEIEQKQR